METLESLGKKLKTSSSIKQVVSTMKALAASNIKRYEKAARSLLNYTKNIEQGIQGIIIEHTGIARQKHNHIENQKKIVIFFGSNQGLCGRFNDKNIEYGLNNLEQRNINRNDCIFISVGDRLAMFLENKNVTITKHFSVPNSLNVVANTVNHLLTAIEELRSKHNATEVLLYYTQHDATGVGTPKKAQLLPIKDQVFEELEKREWPNKQIPQWRGDTQKLLKTLIRQYLFASLYHTLTTSITSEQSNRLITLQSAEKNIGEIIEETKLEFNQRRQSVITSELLDVVSGFQASKKNKKKTESEE
jgi:F-type H+-transporting ATPase subunit gamma